jgi:plastocyanin
MTRFGRGIAVMAAVVVAACGTDTQAAGDAGAAASSVPLTGNVITVEMHGIGDTYFEPKEVTARRGDVLKFVLVSGVHNASFPAEENPAGVALPPTGPYLQVPGQTYEVTVDFPPGEYFFVCDPHWAMDMTGTLTVID